MVFEKVVAVCDAQQKQVIFPRYFDKRGLVYEEEVLRLLFVAVIKSTTNFFEDGILELYFPFLVGNDRFVRVLQQALLRCCPESRSILLAIKMAK